MPALMNAMPAPLLEEWRAFYRMEREEEMRDHLKQRAVSRIEGR